MGASGALIQLSWLAAVVKVASGYFTELSQLKPSAAPLILSSSFISK